ncbi:glycosyltransferase sugar-binding region DXD motif-containing protein-domain-containing protein [Apiospora arundinis]
MFRLAQLRSRRLLPIFVGVALTSLALYIVIRLLAFAQLFGKLGPHAGIEITQQQVLQMHNVTHDPRPAFPKIIHQIFHNWKAPGNHDLPEDWERMRLTCVDKNPGWEFKMWYTENSRIFIEDNYNWFLPTYDSYKYPIQRVDVMRYFLIRHYGGIYVDLDNGCEESLEALRYFPVWTTDGGLGALSNNIIGGHKEHPWLVMMTDNLIPYHWNWILPYAIVMYNSGQWYLTAIWEKYHALLRSDGTLPGFEGHEWKKLHRVLMDSRNGTDPWVFFNHGGHGGTWGAGDDWLWEWIGIHWMEVVAEGIVAVVFSLVCCVWCVRCVKRRKLRNKGYQQVGSGNGISNDEVELGGRAHGAGRRSISE